MGNVHFGIIRNFLNNGVLVFCLSLVLILFGKTFFYVRLIIGERIEFTDVFGKSVVQFGQLLFGNTLDRNGKHGVFAGKIGRVVVLGESDGNILGFADIHTYHLTFESGYERVGTYNQLLICGGASVEFFAVDAAAVIEFDYISVFYGSVFYFDASRRLFSHAVKFRLDVAGSYIILNFFQFNTFVIAEFNLRLYRHHGIELDAVFIKRLNVDFRLVYGINFFMFFQRFLITVVKRVIESIVEEYSRAVHGFYHFSGSLSFAKSRDCILAFVFKVSFIDCVVPFLGVEFKINFYFAFLFFDIVIHIYLRTNDTFIVRVLHVLRPARLNSSRLRIAA